MSVYIKTKKESLVEKASLIRRHILEMAISAGGGHIAPALSVADIMTVLYFSVMRYRVNQPLWKGRDRFFLSKGHACLALYAVLAEAGFISTKELCTFNQDNSCLFGHPERNPKIGIEISTGSLGHALSIACGVAYAAKMERNKFRCFVLMGDGECDEGSVWEAVMFASHWRLDNIVVIIDRNRQQGMGDKSTILESGRFIDKWNAFGWGTQECSGNDVYDLEKAMRVLPLHKNKPSVLVAHTTKGKGVSFMENCPKWHFRGLSDTEIHQARKELGL